MSPEEVVVLSGLFTLVGSTLAWFLARRDKNRQHTQESTTPGAPTVQEIWVRQDNMERAFRSSLVILGEVAEQWQGEHPPVLSKKHLKILADGGYLPSEFDGLITEGEKQ